MSSSQRLLFRVFAVVAALVLANGRVDRDSLRVIDGETVSFGEAARAFVIQSAKAEVLRGQGQIPRGVPGLVPAPWTRVASSICRSDWALVPVEPHGPWGVRVLRRILRMESDEPPLPALRA